MNFKKVLSIASVASIAVVGLVSCGNKEDNSIDENGEYVGNVNIALNYNGAAYVTYGRGTATYDSTYKTIDGRTLTKGKDLTPVWQDIATNMNCNFRDAALTATTAEEQMKSAITSGFRGQNGRKMDMIMITTADDFVSAVNNDSFINLSEHMADLPNLKAWLDSHPSIASQMQMGSDKGIYFTPYFDGIDQVEKGFNMNAEMVRALLDDGETVEGNAFKHSENYDTEKTLTSFYGGTGDTVTSSYIKSMSNQEIAVYDPEGKVGGTAENNWAGKITVSFDKDVATLQNELATKNGANMVATLKSYIDSVYGQYIGEDKLYKTRSEIFTSAKACYNADELIGLLRAVKTNPQYLTGGNLINPLFPRNAERNRASIFFEMAQMFGLRGTNGENGRFWINEAGKLVDTCSQSYALDCIDKMGALQNEDLFPETNYWQQDGSNASSDYRDVQMKAGTCFMTYDYLNVAAYNKDARETADNIVVTKEMQGVLPPYAKWPMTTGHDGKTIVGATSDGYSYTRFTEDNRSLKNSGWAIVASSVSGNDAKLKKCLQIMDYMYSDEGSILECYGVNMQDPNATRDANGNFVSNALADSIETDATGVKYPVLSSAFKTEQKAKTAGTWHNYMTRYLGSCIGIGNIRSNYLESQLTGSYQLVGTEKYANALGAGAMYLTTTYGKNFLASVPTSIAYSETQQSGITSNAADLENWWKITKGSNSLWSSIMLMTIYNGGFSGTGGETVARSTVEGYFTKYNSSKVEYTAQVWGLTADTTNQYAFLK